MQSARNILVCLWSLLLVGTALSEAAQMRQQILTNNATFFAGQEYQVVFLFQERSNDFNLTLSYLPEVPLGFDGNYQLSATWLMEADQAVDFQASVVFSYPEAALPPERPESDVTGGGRNVAGFVWEYHPGLVNHAQNTVFVSKVTSFGRWTVGNVNDLSQAVPALGVLGEAVLLAGLGAAVRRRTRKASNGFTQSSQRSRDAQGEERKA